MTPGDDPSLAEYHLFGLGERPTSKMELLRFGKIYFKVRKLTEYPDETLVRAFMSYNLDRVAFH